MKKVLSVLLIATLVFSLGTVSAFAADTESDASVELRSGEITIIDPGITPPVGYESIKTTKMDFGIHTITGVNATYSSIEAGSQANVADAPGTAQPVGYLITDARGADGLWGVQVKGAVFQSSGADTLEGYTINLVPNGTPIGPVGGNAPTPGSPIISATAGPQRILTANALGSQGMWGANWDAELNVVGGSELALKHKAIITWSITLTP